MGTISTKKKMMIGACALASFALVGVVYSGSQVADNSIYHLNATTTKTFDITFDRDNLPNSSGTISQTFTYQNNVYTIAGGYYDNGLIICKSFISAYSKNGYTGEWTFDAYYIPMNTSFYWLDAAQAIIDTLSFTTNATMNFVNGDVYSPTAPSGACYWKLITTDPGTSIDNYIRFKSISFHYTCNA